MSEFCLIDKNSIITEISRSVEFECVANDLLNHVDMHLNILINNNIKISTNKINFDNLQIIHLINKSSKPFIFNTYKFDLSSFEWIDSNSIKFKPSNYLNYILNSISVKLNKKTTNPIKNIYDTSNKPTTKINLGPKIVGPDVPRPLNSIIIEKTNDLNEESLKQTMDSLQKLKKQEIEKLDELKKTVENDMENFSELYNDHNNKKRDLRKTKEKEKENRNKFDANKEAYVRMKNHIVEGKLEESKISELFSKEYPIFKFLDQQNLLDKEDNYITYMNLYNEMYPNDPDKEEEYVPHNINYLDDQEKQKLDSHQKDPIDEFLDKNVPTEGFPCLEKTLEKINNCEFQNKPIKKYPPIEEILENLDKDDDIEISHIDN